MRYRIKISESDFKKIEDHFRKHFPNEAAVFMLTGISRRDDWIDILVRRVVEITPEDFDVQEEYQLRIAPRAINGLMALCEAGDTGAGFCHSHPREIPYSPTDDFGEERLAETARSFAPPDVPLVSMLFQPEGIFDARIWTKDTEPPAKVEEVVVIGRAIRKIELSNNGEALSANPEMFNRQILAFGDEGQKKIESMKVAVVGVGGTGSACAEQLARLGVKDFTLVDHDRIEASNVSRVYGSFSFPKGKHPPKVEIIRDHLLHINPGASVQVLFEEVQKPEIALGLRDRDVIFLCTDNHGSRAVVNQICHQYFIPIINMGVRLDSTKEGTVRGGVATVDVIRPDKSCLWCKQALNSGRISDEAIPEAERVSRQQEGYIQGMDAPTPTVISFTSLAASLATSCFLQLATDCLRENGDIERLTHSILDCETYRGTTTPDDRCICKIVRAKGDLMEIYGLH